MVYTTGENYDVADTEVDNLTAYGDKCKSRRWI